MSENRYQWTPPPTPKEDLKEVVQYIRRLNVLLPQALEIVQRKKGVEKKGAEFISFHGEDPLGISTQGKVDPNQPQISLLTKIDNTESAGVITAPTLSDEGGDDLGWTAFTYLIRKADDATGTLYYRTMATGTVEITQDTTRYVGVEYNSGSPQVVARTSDTFHAGTDEFLMAIVYNDGGTLHIRSLLPRSGNFQYWANRRLYDVEALVHDSGLTLGEESGAGRGVTMTEGSLYSSLEKYTISAFDSSGTDRFDTYYLANAGSDWTKTASQADWPNTEWNDTGSSGLTEMTASYYANLWFYIETDGHVVMVYGWGEYATIAEAVAESPPTSVPPRIEAQGMLMGRYIFQKSATDPEQISTAFPPPVGGGYATDHGATMGLGDDDHGQYALLAGRATGQGLYGATASGAAGSVGLGLYSTSHAVKGDIYFGAAHNVYFDEATEIWYFNGGDLTEVNDITGNGGSIISGGTGSGDDLYLQSTTHGTHGNIYFGANDYYDEVNESLYINTAQTVSQGIESGAAFIGSWTSGGTAAVMCHANYKTGGVNGYAFAQNSTGSTYINCDNTRSLVFQHNGVQKMVLQSSGGELELTGCNLAMANHDITGLNDITGNNGTIISGGTSASADLYLQSTTNATKGLIYLGANDYYDETNDKLVVREIEHSGIVLDCGTGGCNIQNDTTVLANFDHVEHDLYVNVDMNSNDIVGVDDITGNDGTIISGGTGSGADLYLQSTTHGTKGTVFLGDGDVNINTGVVIVDSTEAQILGYNHCRLHREAVQSINSATWTAIAFDNERWDDAGMHDNSTNNTRITVGASGYYLVGGSIIFDVNAAGIRSIAIYEGGSTYLASQHVDVDESNALGMNLSVATYVYLATGEYVELVVYQDSGGALNVTHTNELTPEFWAVRLRT